ncbi:eukaryotic translation initiation factor 4E family member 2 related sequence 1 isoform X4 [Phyllopteryx taeniolatus]|uniref:eukaryotic translation initiation factor 4E family member 2 related sequence 1 isoform X4 n=1 Tax=Phyllopteryx taeniolatus TaxID=161469 RepID=UPI002AD49CD9|nr:eukaryotic translation initiation factor 4E family member 2 related sequence 1 isoform X4 [Phyllopteryx taeniolatus]
MDPLECPNEGLEETRCRPDSRQVSNNSNCCKVHLEVTAASCPQSVAVSPCVRVTCLDADGGAVLEVLQSSGASRRAEWTQRLPLVQGGHQAYVGGSVSSSQDEYNRSGGKWIIRLRKGLASRFWENIILAMVGEQFMVGEEICGAVVSIRFQEDFLSIWNRTSSDHITTSRIRDTLRRVLNLPANTIMEYKTHNDSLRDNSSFRNTKMSL